MLIITFSTSDLFIFYLGFEGLSIPMFFLIFMFGAEITKIRASIYFLLYSLTSSTFMAISIFLLYSQFGTTDINTLKPRFTSSFITLLSTPTPTNTLGYLTNFIPNLTFERLSLI